MKDILCQAFCASLNMRQVPAGYAVATPYENSDGDPLLLYYIKGNAGNQWRIEDDGTQIPLLEANGVDLKGQARGDALEFLLSEYHAYFDQDARVLHTAYLPESELGLASIRFVALLLRLQDLALLSPHIVRSTFREDVIAAIENQFGDGVKIEQMVSVAYDLPAYEADVVISSETIPRLAVYLATSEERALQALVLKMELEKYRHIQSRVVLLMERAKENPLKESTYALAQARLDDVFSFRGVEADAMMALDRTFRTKGVALQ